MTEKNDLGGKKQPNGKQLFQPTSEGKEETQDCHFIPELNRIDFFSRVRASSTSSKSDLFTQMNINRAIWI